MAEKKTATKKADDNKSEAEKVDDPNSVATEDAAREGTALPEEATVGGDDSTNTREEKAEQLREFTDGEDAARFTVEEPVEKARQSREDENEREYFDVQNPPSKAIIGVVDRVGEVSSEELAGLGAENNRGEEE